MRKISKYLPEFKIEAVRMVEGSVSIAAVARTLGMSDKTLYSWVSADRKRILKIGDRAAVSKPSVGAEEVEITRLRAELDRVTAERDNLDQALIYYTNKSRATSASEK